MRSSLFDQVAAALDAAAAEAVLPYYQMLAEGQVEEKSPGELVTVADREAEQAIERRLAGLVPGARFVGEEACSANPSLLDRIDEGKVWIVDPIDGTGNFAAGRPPFAMMVALLDEGEIIGSWIHDPLSSSIAAAERGAGAWIDGERLKASDSPAEGLRGVVSRFAVPEGMAPAVARIESRVAHLEPNLRCAGDQYPKVACGEHDFALYWRTLVWDHAPGVLLLTEAGGVARRPDGSEYRPGVAGTGLVLARSEAVWSEVAGFLRE